MLGHTARLRRVQSELACVIGTQIQWIVTSRPGRTIPADLEKGKERALGMPKGTLGIAWLGVDASWMRTPGKDGAPLTGGGEAFGASGGNQGGSGPRCRVRVLPSGLSKACVLELAVGEGEISWVCGGRSFLLFFPSLWVCAVGAIWEPFRGQVRVTLVG